MLVSFHSLKWSNSPWEMKGLCSNIHEEHPCYAFILLENPHLIQLLTQKLPISWFSHRKKPKRISYLCCSQFLCSYFFSSSLSRASLTMSKHSWWGGSWPLVASSPSLYNYSIHDLNQPSDHKNYQLLPYDPAIPLLGIHPGKIISWKDTYKIGPYVHSSCICCYDMEASKRPLTDEQIKKMVHIHNEVPLSHLKKWNNAICSNMEGLRAYHTKWSQKDKYHVTSFICKF